MVKKYTEIVSVAASEIKEDKKKAVLQLAKIKLQERADAEKTIKTYQSIIEQIEKDLVDMDMDFETFFDENPSKFYNQQLLLI